MGIDHSNWTRSLDFPERTREKDALPEERFLPAECDFLLRERNWFYSEYDVATVKSVEELLGIYDHSVGQGANFLVNIGPDRRGLLPEVDAQRLLEFAAARDARFASPLPARCAATETGLCIQLETEQLIDHVVLAEELENGDQVEAFELRVRSRLQYTPACVHRGGPIGHKRIIQFPPVRASEVQVHVTRKRGESALRCEVFHTKR